MTAMTPEKAWLAFYAGKDAVPGDRNPYPPGSACWHAWAHGFATEYEERIPIRTPRLRRRSRP